MTAFQPHLPCFFGYCPPTLDFCSLPPQAAAPLLAAQVHSILQHRLPLPEVLVCDLQVVLAGDLCAVAQPRTNHVFLESLPHNVLKTQPQNL